MMKPILAQVRKIWDCIVVGDPTQIAALIAITILVSIFEALGVGLVFVVMTILLGGDLTQFGIALDSLPSWLRADSAAMKIAVCVGFVVLFFVKGLFSLYAQYFQLNFSNNNLAAAAERLQNKNLSMPYVDFVQLHSTDMISLQEHALPQAFTNGVLKLVIVVAELLTIIAIMGVLLLAMPLITLVILTLLSMAMAGYTLAVHLRGGNLGIAQVETKRAALRLAREQLLNAKQIRIQNMVGPMVARFGKARLRQARADTIAKLLSYAPRVLIEVLIVVIVLAWIAIAVLMEQPMQELVATVGLFGAAALRLMPSSLKILSSVTDMRLAAPAVDRIWRELKTAEAQAQSNNDEGELPPLSSEIVLKGIRFSYPGSDVQTLRGIDMIFRHGESVAIVGPSGAGKSTVLDILLGLLSPSSGYIEIDGKRGVPQTAAWRKQIGYVPQSVFLWSGTILENIAFGVDPKKVDRARVKEVLKLANLTDVIDELPEGLDTVVGEMGDRLSGGQRQRVGIARALYHDPPVLVLDEATSALDAEAESIVSNTLRVFRGRKTAILITHRPALAMVCDRVYVLRNGMIEGEGAPDKVLRDSMRADEV